MISLWEIAVSSNAIVFFLLLGIIAALMIRGPSRARIIAFILLLTYIILYLTK